jgi:hypothetical protein
MKKTFVLLISLTLLGSSLSLPAFAAVKAGAKCTTIGQMKTSQGKKFTCIKSGKKLTWNKGVEGAKPASAPQSNAAPKVQVAGGSCSTVGESQKNSLGYLECREIAGNKKVYFQLSNSMDDLPAQNSPLPMSTCRVGDQRATQPTQDNYAIAYPILWSPLPRVGSNKVLFLPFDFPDNPGKGSPKELFSQDIRKFKEWIQHYSNGKFAVEVETSDTWIRASQPSKAYAPYLTHDINPNTKIGFEMLLKDSENMFDYSNVDVVLLIFPSDLKTFKRESGAKGPILQTNKGPRRMGTFSTGNTLYNIKSELWFWLTHELLHSWGIKQHAPAWPAVLSINTGSVGPGQSLITWDSMILDWANPSDVWCSEIDSLKITEVTLAPLEREQKGVKAAMVKLSPSKVLVMESHRKDKWGKFAEGTYGVTAYVVDTRFDTDRSGEYAGVDDFKGTKYTRAANYLEFKFNHGDYKAERFNWETGESWGMQTYFSKNYFLYEGESFTYEGVTVKLVRSGDNDTIQISKS